MTDEKETKAAPKPKQDVTLTNKSKMTLSVAGSTVKAGAKLTVSKSAWRTMQHNPNVSRMLRAQKLVVA